MRLPAAHRKYSLISSHRSGELRFCVCLLHAGTVNDAIADYFAPIFLAAFDVGMLAKKRPDDFLVHGDVATYSLMSRI